MAGYGKYILFTLSLAILTVSCYSVDHLVPTKGCSDQCQEGSSLSSPDTAKFRSCSRGCRFYVIANYVNGPAITQTSTLDFCKSSCEEAYVESKDGSFNSCVKGCQFQDQIMSKTSPKTEVSPQKGDTDSSLISRLLNATPVLQVRKVMADIVGKFQIMTTQVLTYFIRDDNTLIAVQSQPKVIIQEIPEGAEGAPADRESDIHHDYDNNGLLQNDGQFLTGNSPSETVTRVSLDSRRYAYLMHLLLLLAGVSLALLGISYCLALARHQQRKTLKAANLNLALQQEPLKLVRPEDLTKLSLMEEEEAPPLPNKQDLNLNHANV